MARKSVQRVAEEFEQNVISFLKNIGFQDVSGGRNFSFGGVQVDACGGFEGTLLIVECTIASEQKTKSLLQKIREFRGTFDRIKDGVSKDPLYKKYTDFRFAMAINFDPRISDKDEADKDPTVYLWDKGFMEYYEDLRRKIGEYAKFNLLGEMNVKPRWQKPIQVPAMETRLGNYIVYNFFMEPKELLRISYVARRESGNERYYQRLIIPGRLKKIGKFLDNGGIFPNSIIIAFNEIPRFTPYKEVETDPNWPTWLIFGLLSFPNDYRSCWIVDGQHRLYSFANSLSKAKVSIVAFQNLKLAEQAEFFLEINRTQKPVPPDLVWDLEGELRPDEPDGIISRVAKELDKKQPLAGKIYIPLQGPSKSQKLKLSGICMAIKRRGLTREQTEHPQGRSNPLFSSDSQKLVRNLTDTISNFLSIVDSNFDEKVKKEFLFQNSGISVLIALFERFINRFGKSPTANELNPYLSALANHLKRYDTPQDLKRLRIRCTSEGGRDEVSAELIRAMRVATNDERLAPDIPAWTYELRIKKIERDLANKIASILKEQTSNWYRERIEEQIRKDAIERMRRSGGTKIQDFFTLGECYNIMTRKDNWPLFRNIFIGGSFGFGSDQELEAAFHFLNRIRAAITHGRTEPFKYKDEELLNIYLDILEKCLGIQILT
jgi:DGQHR domain-containing protein